MTLFSQISLGFLGNLGPMEIILIVLAILILFGAKKIPELAQGVGKGMKEFKKALREVEDEVKSTDSKKTPDDPKA
ncbi:Sec-independent protein translocase protein TatA [uncultured bacterium]|nr:Sec-independent protein translocase protein TatA [uncultured bacterium]